MDFAKYIQNAKQKVDMSKPSEKGAVGDYQPPAQGPCLLRFVGYVEIGKQKDSWQGQEKIVNKAMLVFELHGKNYPVQEINGEKVAKRITVTESISTSPKSNFYKLFMTMRGNSDATHIAELLGKPFKGRVYHKEWEKDGKKQITARLRDESGYSIDLPVFEDPESGEVRMMNVPPQVSKTRLFLWDFATKEMWDNITLPGDYNPFIDKIKQAVNFSGSAAEAASKGLCVEDLIEDAKPPQHQVTSGFRQQAPGGTTPASTQTPNRVRTRGIAAPPAPTVAEFNGDQDPFGDV